MDVGMSMTQHARIHTPRKKYPEQLIPSKLHICDQSEIQVELLVCYYWDDCNERLAILRQYKVTEQPEPVAETSPQNCQWKGPLSYSQREVLIRSRVDFYRKELFVNWHVRSCDVTVCGRTGRMYIWEWEAKATVPPDVKSARGFSYPVRGRWTWWRLWNNGVCMTSSSSSWRVSANTRAWHNRKHTARQKPCVF